MTIGERLRRARTRRKKTQDQIAEECGVTQPTVSGWESDTSVPEPRRIVEVAKAYGLRPEHLIPGAS